MAKTKDKKGGKGGLAVRRVTSAKQRQTGGFFMRLKTDEWMKAYALFTPDPEADKNPGYYEYFEHYDKPNNQYVPCAGDDCYMCELGDNPSVRALTLWYFPDNPAGQKLKVLKLNGYMIRDFSEIEAEEGGVFGKRFRVKRLSDKGEYRISPQTDKPLKKAESSALLKDAAKGENENSAGKIDFEALTLRQLKAALEKNEAVGNLTDADDDEDEDEDDEEKPKARRGRAKAQETETEDDDDEDEDEDEDSDDDEDDDSDDEDEDDDSDDDEDDDENDDDDESDDDEDDSDEDESEDEDESDDESEDEDEDEGGNLSKAKFTVEATNEDEETITVKIDGKKVKLWLGQGVDADWDVVKKGAEITVDAATDEEGDFVVTALKAKAPKAGKDAKGGKGGKKGGKKK